MNSCMLFILFILTIYYKSLMHVWCKSTLCQNRAHWAIFAVLNSNYVINPHWTWVMEGICFCQSLLNLISMFILFTPMYHSMSSSELLIHSHPEIISRSLQYPQIVDHAFLLRKKSFHAICEWKVKAMRWTDSQYQAFHSNTLIKHQTETDDGNLFFVKKRSQDKDRIISKTVLCF